MAPAIDASAIDASMIDLPMDLDAEVPADVSPSSVCSTAVDDMFTGLTPCAGWGASFTSNTAAVTSGNGELRITVTSSASESNAGCNSGQFLFIGSGVIAHITSITTGINSYNGLQIHGSSLDAALNVNGGFLKFQTSNAGTTWNFTTYDAVTMAWLRMWPDRTSNDVVAEYSADGQTWTELGRRAMNLPQMATFTLIGGVNAGGIYTGTTRFSRFIICQ